MTRAEQELSVIDNRADEKLIVSSTHPSWTRKLNRLEQQGLARRTRTITAVESGKREVLGGEWEVDRASVALRLAVRRKASAAQRGAAAKAAAARFRRQTNAGATISTPSRTGNGIEVVPGREKTRKSARAMGKLREAP